MADMWNEGEIVAFVGAPLERLGPSTYYCADCGILELVPQKDEGPHVEGPPSTTNFHGVRNDDYI
jgi:hypothetical protein